ncbi:glutathione S-transferase [Ahniella affigens]|uniref:Glutathione S-transferase n=1 Tax=Ahniella affigens TaxID=2021234 RepID=A0A2P1PQ46_9GAMM|nr:glutathione S-transferase family protein [Ahniella affigens]AVP96952.1 glutathione S-transferase [Ahniella affigens]
MQKPLLVIGNQNYSSWSLRPWVFLKAFGVDFDCDVVPMLTEDFDVLVKQRSPTGKVPFLLDDGLVVNDSLAICGHAIERWIGADRAWPESLAARALARSAVAEMHSGFTALRNQCPMNVRRRSRNYRLSGDTQKDVERILAIWNQARSDFGGGGPYLFGAFSVADAFFAPVVFRFQTYAVGLDGNGAKYCEAMLAHPAMRAWADAAEREPWALERYEFVQG